MTFAVYTDGEVLAAADVDTLMRQGIVPFGTRAARTAALAPLDAIPQGMLTWLLDEQVAEQYRGSQWVVALGARIRVALSAPYTPPASSDASLATTWAALALPAAGTYRVVGALYVPTGTMRVTSIGTGLTGVWGCGEGADLFDQTAGAAEFGLTAGIGIIGGEVTAAAAATWTVRGFYGLGGATLAEGSHITVERVA